MRPVRAALLAMLLLGVTAAHGETAPHATPVRVEDMRFVDNHGREIILRGVNAGSKDHDRRYQSPHTPEDFQHLARWGLNCVRLLIFWDGIEPQPGQFDHDYLDLVAQRVEWAHLAGLFVILDMHQDLYSRAIPGGNGAPPWATLTNDQPHIRLGGSWGTAYYTSPMLHAAFDNFWENAPGPGGIGIQERFARAWGEVARRFAGTPGIIGYDILNEPFLGGGVHRVVESVLWEVPGLLDGLSLEALAADGAGDMLDTILNATDDPERFPALLGAIERTHAHFERGSLAGMHRRVAAAIRQHDSERIVFIQPGIMANSGAPSHTPPIVYDDGSRDPRQAYAPHTYDLVVDTPRAHAPSEYRLGVNFDNIAAHASHLQLPTLSGEWGAFYGNNRCQNAARIMARHFEHHRMGDLYWDFHAGIENTTYFEMIQRPYPVAVAGTLESWRLDPESGVFQCTWNENPAITAPTRVYVCDRWFSGEYTVSLDPPGNGYTHAPLVADSADGHLVIPPTGQALTRTLRLEPPLMNGEAALLQEDSAE